MVLVQKNMGPNVRSKKMWVQKMFGSKTIWVEIFLGSKKVWVGIYFGKKIGSEFFWHESSSWVEIRLHTKFG